MKKGTVVWLGQGFNFIVFSENNTMSRANFMGFSENNTISRAMSNLSIQKLLLPCNRILLDGVLNAIEA